MTESMVIFQDFPFDRIASAPARYISHVTQILHLISIALVTNLGL